MRQIHFLSRLNDYYIKSLILKHLLMSHIFLHFHLILFHLSTRNQLVSQLQRNTMPFSISFSIARITYPFIALRRGRRRFHVSGCWRSERRIRQLQQTRPSGGLQKVLHMPWGHRQGVRLPDWHRFQDRRRWRQRRLRGSRGCSRMVSIVFNTYTISSRSCHIFSCVGKNKLWDYKRSRSFEEWEEKIVQ